MCQSKDVISLVSVESQALSFVSATHAGHYDEMIQHMPEGMEVRDVVEFIKECFAADDNLAQALVRTLVKYRKFFMVPCDNCGADTEVALFHRTMNGSQYQFSCPKCYGDIKLGAL